LSTLLLLPLLVAVVVLDFGIFGAFAVKQDQLNPVSRVFYNVREGLNIVRNRQNKQKRNSHEQLFTHRWCEVDTKEKLIGYIENNIFDLKIFLTCWLQTFFSLIGPWRSLPQSCLLFHQPDRSTMKTNRHCPITVKVLPLLSKNVIGIFYINSGWSENLFRKFIKFFQNNTRWRVLHEILASKQI